MNYTTTVSIPVTAIIKAEPFTAEPKRWQLQERHGSGLFLRSTHGTLLCRIDRERGIIYLWDKRAGIEVAINPAELFESK